MKAQSLFPVLLAGSAFILALGVSFIVLLTRGARWREALRHVPYAGALAAVGLAALSGAALVEAVGLRAEAETIAAMAVCAIGLAAALRSAQLLISQAPSGRRSRSAPRDEER